MEKLYTLIIDFRGGTYISQVKAFSEKDALIKGISNLEPRSIQYFGEKTKNRMLDEALNEEPTPIMENHNVFLASLSPMGHFTYVHIILTEST